MHTLNSKQLLIMGHSLGCAYQSLLSLYSTNTCPPCMCSFRPYMCSVSCLYCLSYLAVIPIYVGPACLWMSLRTYTTHTLLFFTHCPVLCNPFLFPLTTWPLDWQRQKVDKHTCKSSKATKIKQDKARPISQALRASPSMAETQNRQTNQQNKQYQAIYSKT